MSQSKVCPVCGKRFTDAKRIEKRSYCSSACANKGRPRELQARRACARCGEPIKSRNSYVRYCSVKCQHEQRFGATVEERFWAKVDKGDGEGCWLWTGGTGAGYGHFMVDGKHTLAHRYSYALKNGPIPEGLQILHQCDVSLCCNPSHLRVGTAYDNKLEAVERGQAPTGERHYLRRNPERTSQAFIHSPRRHGADNAKTKLTEEDVLAIYRRAKSGEKRQALATEYGISMSSVYNIARKVTWSELWERVDVSEIEGVDGSKGSGRYNAILNDDLVRTLRVRCAAGERPLDLAHEYGLSIGTVRDAVGRKTWRHVA